MLLPPPVLAALQAVSSSSIRIFLCSAAAMALLIRAAGLVIAVAAQAARGIIAPFWVDASDTDSTKNCSTGEPGSGFCGDPLRDASTGVCGESKTPCDALKN